MSIEPGGRHAHDVQVSATVRSPVPLPSILRLARHVLRAEKADVASLSITLVGPARMKSLNRKYLRRNRETDVIAFAFGPPLVGDVYVCPAVAAKAAKAFGTTPGEELRRLVVHGVLHVLGHDHPDKGRTESAMWHRQERHLATAETRAG